MRGQAGPLQGLPQGVAVGAGRFQGYDQAPPPANPLQQLGEAVEVGGVAAAPGALEVVGGPAEHAQDVVLADVQSGVHERLVPRRQQAVELHVIDSEGAVCFALHGDDLPHVGPVIVPQTPP